MKKYSSEALGTAVLALVVSLSVAGTFPVATPLLAALTLGLFVYSLGHVSGTHINPAVTIGLWTLGKVTTKEAGAYILAQVAGTVAAMLILQSYGAVGLPEAATGGLLVGLAEMVGMFVFTFGVASVVYGKTPAVFSGVVVGGSLLLGIAVASLMGSAGVLNPAVALALNTFTIFYVCGPVLGAVLGMQCYRLLATTEPV